MLVLSRKREEAILIGDDIVVHVNRLSPSRVSLAITAPDCTILRGELEIAGDSGTFGPGSLVLSRKQGQTIRIGAHIVLHIVEIRGNCVKIGCDVPRDVLILRDELKPFDGDPQMVA